MTPPRFARWLLERRFAGEAAESILGDLNEEFSQRAARDGAFQARRWFWRQALTSVLSRELPMHTPVPVRPRTFLSDFVSDLKTSARSLRYAPGFALTAIITLSLGVGAATAIGTAASRTLLRPLPYPSGEQLIVAGHADDDGEMGNVGYETALDWRDRVSAFEQTSVLNGWHPTLTETAGAERLDGMRVNWNFFRMLGVRPALGRDFEMSDDRPDTWRVVMLSDSLWRRRFNADPAIVGRTIQFNGRPYAVAGVMPASFEPLISQHFFDRAEIWAPLGYIAGGDSSCRSCRHLKFVARVKSGVSTDAARSELIAVQRQLSSEHPNQYIDRAPVMVTLAQAISSELRQPLLVLLGAVAFVLLVACANVAGLLMSRAADREREMVLRAALGADRGRLMRQLLTEALLLALASAVGGVSIARATLRTLAARAPVHVPRLDQASSDPWLMAMAGAIALGTILLFAIVPAWSGTRTNLESSLRETRHSSGRHALRLREWLMAAEVAAALLIVIGGGLMYRTVDRLLHVNPGFKADNVLTAGVSLVGARWAEDRDVFAFQQDVLQKVRALPGVESAAFAGQIPLGGNYDRWGFRPVGRTYASSDDAPSVERYGVTPGYFAAMGIPLIKGRLLNEQDTATSQRVMLISESTAESVFPGEDPIGRVVRFGSDRNPRELTIVGIVGSVRHYDLGAKPTPQFYVAQSQITDSYLVLVVRASHAEQLTGAIRQIVAARGSDVPVYDVAMLEQRLDTSVATRSFLMLLLGALAGITLLLAGVGLYGVVSQTVAARRRELGIRVALGASHASVLTLLARRGVTMFAGGSTVGLMGGVAAGYAIQSQLYEVKPVDPVTLAIAISVLACVVAIAHIGPLRRALRAQPTEVLRPD